MGVIVASNLIQGEHLIFKDAPKPIERNNEGSFQALRQKLEPQVSEKIREVDDTLIQYKESAFLSDMLSSSKD